MLPLALSACAHSRTTQEDVARLRKEVYGLRRDLVQAEGEITELRRSLDVLRAARSTVSAAPTPGHPSLPVIRLSSDGTVDADDVGAVDDGRPPILIKMGPAATDRVSVNREVLRKPDPVLTASDADPRASYDAALARLRRHRQPEEALTMFRAFIAEYPDHGLTDNAVYWSGEASLALKDYPAAMRAFRRVLRAYPSSAKVPWARLKIGEALLASGKTAEGAERLRDLLRTHPGTEAASEALRLLEGSAERKM